MVHGQVVEQIGRNVKFALESINICHLDIGGITCVISHATLMFNGHRLQWIL